MNNPMFRVWDIDQSIANLKSIRDTYGNIHVGGWGFIIQVQERMGKPVATFVEFSDLFEATRQSDLDEFIENLNVVKAEFGNITVEGWARTVRLIEERNILKADGRGSIYIEIGPWSN